jgi:hypothetical protein
MAITYHPEKHIFKLDTTHTSYLNGLTPEGYIERRLPFWTRSLWSMLPVESRVTEKAV